MHVDEDGTPDAAPVIRETTDSVLAWIPSFVVDLASVFAKPAARADSAGTDEVLEDAEACEVEALLFEPEKENVCMPAYSVSARSSLRFCLDDHSALLL